MGLILVSAVLTALIFLTVPSDASRQAGLPLNLLSSSLLTGTVMAMVLATTLLPTDFWPLGLALAGAAFFLGMILRIADPRRPAPLLPVAISRHRLVRRGLQASVINTATSSSAATVLTLFLQDTLHRGPLVTAAILLPFSLAVILGSASAPMVIAKTSREHAVAVGHGVIALGLALLIVSPQSYACVAASMGLAGTGLGIASVPATSLGTDAPSAHRATASGLVNTGTQLGTAVGTAVLIMITAATTGIPESGSAAPRPAWAAATALALFGSICFAALHRRDRRAEPSEGD